MRRPHIFFILAGVLASLGAAHRTPNFVVQAPTAEVARQVGQYAEHYRREKAVQWLGEEMPPWPQPCPLHVSVTMEPPSGDTTFTFGHDHRGLGQVMSMRMNIRGPLDRLLASVLPHEITHTVFAHYFRCPVPRWADEGGSVLSEDVPERDRHDRLTRHILNQGRQIRLRTLLPMREYPRDVHCLYAQGFSITDYLVRRSDRKTFLQFVRQGMQNNWQNWDSAVKTFFGHRTVEELEGAWLAHLRDPHRAPDTILAHNQPRPSPSGGVVVRLTVPPVQPLDPPPVARAARPDPAGLPYGENPGMAPPSAPVGAWQAVPVFAPAGQPTAPPGFMPAPVTLGPPIFDPQPPMPIYPSPLPRSYTERGQ